MNEKIITFIKKMHVLTLGVIHENKPYLCSSFYAFNEEFGNLIIAGSHNTTHIRAALNINDVFICIALNTKTIGIIKGIQASGKFTLADDASKRIYFKRFIYAMALKPNLYSIKLEWIKYTDNSLGFGKKIEWTLEN